VYLPLVVRDQVGATLLEAEAAMENSDHEHSK